MTKHKLQLALVLALVALTAVAGDVYVGTTGDLTNAIANAVNNDTVWLSNGTYTCTSLMEESSFLNIGAGVTVRSISGTPADVVLDADGKGRVALMTASSWLIGVTVTNGYILHADGGGVKRGSISNCTVTGSASDYAGGGAFGCTLYGCSIIGNTAGAGGGAVNAVLHNCKIIGNIAENGGGTMASTLYNCTLVENTASGVVGGGTIDSTLYNSISWNNSHPDDFSYTGSNCYSCGVGYTGIGSITNDPLFVGGGNYRLQAGSPCINTGTNGAWTTGARDLDGNQRIWPKGGTVDMGAYEYGSQAEYPIPRIRASSLTTIRGASIMAIRGR